MYVICLLAASLVVATTAKSEEDAVGGLVGPKPFDYPCVRKNDCMLDLACVGGVCGLDPEISNYNQWYSGQCVQDLGRSENLGNGLGEEGCLAECKKQPFTACELKGWTWNPARKRPCYRHTRQVITTDNVKASDCYIAAPALPKFHPWLAKSCKSNAECTQAYGEGLYCAVKNSKVKHYQLTQQAKCAPADDCCKNLDSIEGRCPKTCQNLRTGGKWYKPIGMNKYIGARPRGEGATSYDLERAMQLCNQKGDCNGLTCNVNNQGWKKCELRKRTDSGYHNRGDCEACLSYRKASTTGSCNLVMTGESPTNCKWINKASYPLGKDACEAKCLSDSECNAFVIDSQTNYCFLDTCPETEMLESGPTGQYAHYTFYACFDYIMGVPDYKPSEEATVGYFMEDAVIATAEGDGASFLLYGFAAIGFGVLFYGAGKHYTKGSTHIYSTVEA